MQSDRAQMAFAESKGATSGELTLEPAIGSRVPMLRRSASSGSNQLVIASSAARTSRTIIVQESP